jgi:hypothetical protein
VPSYSDDGNFGVGATRKIEYRATGTSDWTTIPTGNWSWNTAYTLLFSGLTAGTEYEIKLSGQNGRVTPTTSTATVTFKTPGDASSGTGTASFTILDTVDDDPYYVSIRNGDTVLHSDTVTGNGDDIPHEFSNLPDGFYNIVVEHDGEIVTKTVEISGGAQVSGSLSVELKGTINTRVTIANDSTPKIAVDGLDGLFGATDNTSDSAGITTDDNTVLDNSGNAVIELIATGLAESDVPTDVNKINAISSGQKLAMVVDLSLYKTVRENNAASGVTNRLTSISSLITVAVPLASTVGSGIKAYRVHDDVAQLIPEAVLDSTSGNYVWKDNYEIDSITYTGGNVVGVNDEYVVFENGWAIFHVKKFSTYAISYRSSASGSSPVTNSVSTAKTGNGNVMASPGTQVSGSLVKLTVTPDDGYSFGGLTIKDTNGNTIAYTKLGDGTYQFTMPGSVVTVSATFIKDVVKPADTGVANWLITNDHIGYMNGDNHGHFDPDKNMTRAEAAQMFYNLLLNKNVKTTVSFSDLSNGSWYEKAVETLAGLGIITGNNGAYRPGDNISRAEFAAIAMRFAVLSDGEASFNDVSNTYWAYNYIMSAASYGWINGYSDGTYRPKALITRAEVVTIANNMLSRSADKAFIDENRTNLKIFPDVANESYWAYYGIVEATNGHDFKITDSHENWTQAD